MQDDEKTGRAAQQDRVDEAAAGSFPASDPPAWTAARTGKPESRALKDARATDEALPPVHCEAIGLFATEAEAQAAADALLGSGFNLVEIGPPRSHGNLGAGLGAPPRPGAAQSAGLAAAIGALAAGALAALFVPRRARHLAVVAAAGGAVGALSARAVSRMGAEAPGEPDWPPNGVLLRVRIRSAEDQLRALATIEAQGARKLHTSWRRLGR